MILAVFTMVAFMPNMAVADEFGERFHAQTPSGLGEYTAMDSEIPDITMDDVAKTLQDIMPAAGDEEVERESTDDASIVTPSKKPAQD